MNQRQKIYESKGRSNILSKVENNYFHYLNLKEIRRRKPVYCSTEKLNHQKKNISANYYIKKENKYMQKMLNAIYERPVRPKINSLVSAKEMHDDLREKYQELRNKKIRDENSFYRKRIASQKPFLCVKSMDLEFENSKNNMKRRLDSGDVILPPIWMNPRNLNKKSYTESKIDCISDKRSLNSIGGNISEKNMEKNRENSQNEDLKKEEN